MYDLYVWLRFEATSTKCQSGVLIWHYTSSVGIVFSVCHLLYLTRGNQNVSMPQIYKPLEHSACLSEHFVLLKYR